jgi:hypothetical protein
MAAHLQEMKPLFESGELKAPDLSKYTQVKLADAVMAYHEMERGSRNKYVIVND